jgi:integrase
MAKKKKGRYGDYTEIIGGDLYGVVNLRQPSGKYKKKRKKFASKTEALQWALAELAKHKKAAAFDVEFTFTDLVDWYKQEFLHKPHYEKDLKVSGVKDYARAKNKIDRFAAYFGSLKIEDFTEYHLRQWERFRRDTDKVLTATINRDLALMRTMFRRALRYRKINRIPNFEIKTVTETERDRVITPAEEQRILAACVSEETIKVKTKKGTEYEMTIDAKREHLRAVIILAVDTAMRLGEIFSLEWRDVDFDRGIITLQASKTKSQRSRQIGLTARARRELETISENSDKRKTSKVFDIKSPVRAFRTACRRAGIVNLHFHDLRHSAITRMIRAGIPHTEVMKISGHRTLSTFMRYLNLQTDAISSASEKLAKYLDEQAL